MPAGLKLASAGGMAVQRVVAERWKQATGVPIVEGYGLTETIGPISFNAPHAYRPGAVGRPIPAGELEGDPAEVTVRLKAHVEHGLAADPDRTFA
mgnify:CR=1 FL=1